MILVPKFVPMVEAADIRVEKSVPAEIIGGAPELDAVTERVANALLPPPIDPVMFDVPVLFNDVTVNVAVVCPARTVTDAGTVATVVSLLWSVTTMPPVGATVSSVTVPVDVVGNVTLDGTNPTEETLPV